MLKDGKYRFSLQFGADCPEQIRVGAFLEKLGNRKSHVIVEAVTEYLENHPELEASRPKIEVKRSTSLDRQAVEALIRSILQENPGLLPCQETPAEPHPAALEADVAQMLDNLELFL